MCFIQNQLNKKIIARPKILIFHFWGSFRALKNGVTPVVIIRHTLCTNWRWLNVGLLSCPKTLFTPWKNYFISNRFFNNSWFVTVFYERLCTNWRWHNFNCLSWLNFRLYAMEKDNIFNDFPTFLMGIRQ